MGRRNESEQEPERSAPSSRTAGACIVVVLVLAAGAAVFAISYTAGVLTVWVVGAVALWRAIRSMSDSSATPPPLPASPSGDVYAGETGEIERVEWGPEGVTCIIHPVRGEVRDQ